MKYVVAIIRPHYLDKVREELKWIRKYTKADVRAATN